MPNIILIPNDPYYSTSFYLYTYGVDSLSSKDLKGQIKHLKEVLSPVFTVLETYKTKLTCDDFDAGRYLLSIGETFERIEKEEFKKICKKVQMALDSIKEKNPSYYTEMQKQERTKQILDNVPIFPTDIAGLCSEYEYIRLFKKSQKNKTITTEPSLTKSHKV